MEGTHISFLILITGKQERRKGDGTWSTQAEDKVGGVAGTQLDTTYIRIRNRAVAQWVAFRPIFEVCARKTGC